MLRFLRAKPGSRFGEREGETIQLYIISRSRSALSGQTERNFRLSSHTSSKLIELGVCKRSVVPSFPRSCLLSKVKRRSIRLTNCFASKLNESLHNYDAPTGWLTEWPPVPLIHSLARPVGSNFIWTFKSFKCGRSPFTYLSSLNVNSLSCPNWISRHSTRNGME